MDILQAQVYSGDICKSLVCHDATTGNCYILGDAPAAMGTTCGNKKVKKSDFHFNTVVHMNSIVHLTSFLSNENNNSISFFFCFLLIHIHIPKLTVQRRLYQNKK